MKQMKNNYKEKNMKAIIDIEKNVEAWLNKNRLFVVLQLIFGALLYFMMMSENLYNDMDGIWHTSNFIAGNWEISLGRGLLRYFDKLRFGVVSVPFNVMLTILIVSIGNIILLEMLSIKERVAVIIFMGILIANPVVGFTLSYSFTSVNYVLAYLFAIGAVYFLYKISDWKVILLSGIFVMMSLGCYQAYIGVVGVIFIAILMQKLGKNEDKKSVIGYVLRGIGSILLGGILYIVMTNLLLRKAGVNLASYKGASSISLLSIIRSFPDSIIKCYRNFITYFGGYNMYNTMSTARILLMGIAAISIFCILYQLIKIYRTNKWYAVVFLACVLLLPVCCNCMLIIAVGNNVSLLMSMGMMICSLLSVAFLPQMGKIAFGTKRVCYLIMALFLWTNILTVTNDQIALKEGKTATVELANRIIDELSDEGYLTDGYLIALVGRPAENDTFIKNGAYQNANEYAKFGNYWSTEAGNNRRSWQGVLSEYCGTSLSLCSEEQYDAVVQEATVAEMPEFPAVGSIREINGVIVVKVSQLY